MLRLSGKATTKLYCLIALQATLIIVLLFLPFGFEQPSSWGLHYGHFFLILAAYIVMLLAGLIEAAVERKWFYITMQMALSVLAVVAYLK